jgi:hypothetical protein
MKLFVVHIAKPAEHNAKTQFIMGFTVMAESEQDAIQIIAAEWCHRTDSLIKCRESTGVWEHRSSFSLKRSEVAEEFANAQLIADVLGETS